MQITDRTTSKNHESAVGYAKVSLRIPVIPATHSGARRPVFVGAKRRWFFSVLKVFLLSQFVFHFAHRFSFQCDAVAVVNEPIAEATPGSKN
jgi:hypothetical protein